MNNNDMDEMVKKAQEMIKNNQIPDNLKNLATMFQSSNATSNSDNTKGVNSNLDASFLDSISNLNNNKSINNLTNNNSNETQNSNNSFSGNIDMGTLMKIQSIMSKMNTLDNDDMSKLLMSLKPYMRNEKKGKIDEYISLIKMGKMTQLIESLGNNKTEG